MLYKIFTLKSPILKGGAPIATGLGAVSIPFVSF